MKSSTRVVLLLALISLVGGGCDRNVEDFDPAERPHQPDLSRIFPAPEGDSPQGGAGAMGAGAMPTAQPDAGRPGASVRGTIRVDSDPDASPERILFLIARPAGAVGGPPLAVVRIPEPVFPLDFEIGPADVMIPTMRFEGAIELTARLDGDGNASTRAEGDRETASATAVVPGAVGVELRLE
jgi:hypothetical protein